VTGWEPIALGALGFGAVVGLLVWLIKSRETLAIKTWKDRSEAAKAANDRTKEADDAVVEDPGDDQHWIDTDRVRDK
jgi:hypothetical protein